MSLRDTLVQTINEELMPKFRTKVEELLPKIPEKASSEQIAAMLRNNGVTADEIRWTKLDQVLKQPKVTKAEIVAHLKQHGLPFAATDHVQNYGKKYEQYALKGGRNYGEKIFRIKRTEAVKGDELEWDKARPDAYNVVVQWYGYRPGADRSGRYNPPDAPWADVYAEKSGKDDGPLTYLKIIGRVKDEVKHYREVFSETCGVDDPDLDSIIEKAKADCEKEWRNENAMDAEDGNNFHSNHWAGANPLFHIRHQEFTDADGKELWLIEEIQSDWHQAGRKRGYSDGKKKFQILFNNNPLPVDLDSGNEFSSKEDAEKYVKDSIPESMRSKITYRAYGPGGIPDAPMKKTWEEMAFKWALHQAVEANADRIGWVTGQISADRYDLRKKISKLRLINVQKKYPTTWAANKDKPSNAVFANNGNPFQILAYDHKDAVIVQKYTSEEGLSDIIGKELATKLLAQPENQEHERSLEGADMEVGGEGMKAAYDQRIPSIAKKIAKATGAMMGKVMISDAEDEGEEVDPYEATDLKVELGELDSDGDFQSVDPDDVIKGRTKYYLTFDGSVIEAGGGPFDTEEEANAAREQALTIRPAKKGHEVWYLEINNKVRDLVAGGMRATFEAVKPKATKPWWLI